MNHHYKIGITIALLALAGCGESAGNPGVAGASATGAAIQGRVYGGQQPVSGSQVYVYAVGTSGYGGASTSLLTSVAGQTNIDSNGHYYVTTNTNGNFSITGDYTCTPQSQIYLYAVGGNASAGVNSAIGALAALGTCPSSGSVASTVPFVTVNEVSTVATAYSLAGFALDPTHISSSSSTLAATGVANAMSNVSALESVSTGVALASSPYTSGSTGIVPQAEINTIANILASCINSTGPSSSGCTTLFANTRSSGTTGTVPTDTAAAAINLAHNPATSVSTLFALPTGSPPFQPVLSAAPNDFSLALQYTGGGLANPYSIAVDAAGRAWVSNYSGNSVTVFSNLGVSQTYTAGALNGPFGLAIDDLGNVWIANEGNSTVSELSSSGVNVSGSPWSGGGISNPVAIAIDAGGSVWIANSTSVSKLSSAGVPASGSPFAGTSISSPSSIAVQPSGSVWVANSGTSSLTEISSSGSSISNYTGGGLSEPGALAIDGSGNLWTSNLGGGFSKFTSGGSAYSSSAYTGGGEVEPEGAAIDGAGNLWSGSFSNTLVEISSTGTALSPSTGYVGGGIHNPYGVAVDGSGDVWVVNNDPDSVTEFLGLAAPVVTPIAAAVATAKLGTKP